MTDAPLTTDAGDPIALDDADPFILRMTVGDDHIDAQGHVNNAVYVQWMDRAAYGHSSQVGYTWERYQELGAAFVVRRHEIDYLGQAFADDRIIIATWPGRMRRFTALRHHQMVRQSDGQTLARAMTTWVYLDLKTGRPRRMPDEMIAAFRPRD